MRGSCDRHELFLDFPPRGRRRGTSFSSGSFQGWRSATFQLKAFRSAVELTEALTAIVNRFAFFGESKKAFWWNYSLRCPFTVSFTSFYELPPCTLRSPLILRDIFFICYMRAHRLRLAQNHLPQGLNSRFTFRTLGGQLKVGSLEFSWRIYERHFY